MIFFIFVLLFQRMLGQWEPDIRLTNNPFESWTSYNNSWCIATSGSNLHVVWWDYRDGNYEIYYKRSLDNETTWSEDIRLTNNIADSKYPSIAVYGSNVHIVWLDGRDGGSQIYYKHSLDNGTNWSVDTRLTESTTWSDHPSIAVYGSYVHVVWNDGRNGPNQIIYKRSLDNGLTWSSDYIFANSIANWSSIAVSGSNVHVAWVDSRDGNCEIYYKHSFDNGTNWSADTRLTDSPYFSVSPSIAISGSNIHVVWEDNRDATYQVYYKHSLDNGTNWSADTRLTYSTYVSWYPSIAVSGPYIHLVWTDNRDGNWEIYYKHNPTGNGIEQEKTSAPNIHSFFVPSFFNDQISIKFNQFVKEPTKIVLYDISGNEVFSKTLLIENIELKIDNFTHLPSGVYFLNIDFNRQNIIQKLVKFR